MPAREFIVKYSLGECSDRLRRAHQKPTFDGGLRTDVVLSRVDADTTQFEISRLPNRERPALEYDYDLEDIKETLVLSMTGFLYRLTDYSTMVTLEPVLIPNWRRVAGRGLIGWFILLLILIWIDASLALFWGIGGIPLTAVVVGGRLYWRRRELETLVRHIFT